jgi:MFS family permease
MVISRQRERQRAIYAILTSTTLNLLGFTLTSPLNPALGSHFDLPLGASFGSLTSAYPAGMLLGQLVWARMSDFIGRKRILSISLLGGGIGLTLQSMSICYKTSLHVFLATRVFTGVFSGVAPVAKAYLADLGEEVERSKGTLSSSSEQGLVAKYLGWRDAASTLAYILGPALGGILFERVKDSAISTTTTSNETGALAFVIGIAGLASIIASGCITMFVREEFKPKQTFERRRQSSKHSEYKSKEESKMEAIAEKSYESMSCPLGSQLWSGVASVCIISFLYHVSDSTFFAFYPALLQNRFGLDARAVGMSFTGFACISFLFSAMSLSSRMIEKVGVVYTCVAGLTSLGTGLTALSFLGKTFASSISLSSLKVFTWLSAAVYFSGVPLYGPTVPLMLLMCVPSHHRGAIMGLDGAVNTIARIISPIIMGDVYRRGGSQLTFRLAGAAAFASAGIASSRRFYVHRRAKKEKSS